MCSRSGYYDWISLGKPLYKSFNESINQLVLSEYFKDKRQGIVSLKMKIKKIHGSILTRSTVYRYMRLNQIQSIIRRKRYKWGKKPHHYIPNLLKRDFTTNTSNQKWSIDISYLLTTNKTLYLCAIKDMHDKSIVSYTLSKHMNQKLVNETIYKAIESTPLNQRIGLVLHSDQGSHFTNESYARLLENNQIRHSVSYKGNCVDNSPIETWFSALKTESLYLQNKVSEDETKSLVEAYIKYYNEERLQLKIKELAPIEYRKQVLSVFFNKCLF